MRPTAVPQPITHADLPEYYNPLIQTAYRAMAAGALFACIWKDTHGIPVGAYPGQAYIESSWALFQKYDAANFDLYVERFNEHFRDAAAALIRQDRDA